MTFTKSYHLVSAKVIIFLVKNHNSEVQPRSLNNFVTLFFDKIVLNSVYQLDTYCPILDHLHGTIDTKLFGLHFYGVTTRVNINSLPTFSCYEMTLLRLFKCLYWMAVTLILYIKDMSKALVSRFIYAIAIHMLSIKF